MYMGFKCCWLVTDGTTQPVLIYDPATNSSQFLINQTFEWQGVCTATSHSTYQSNVILQVLLFREMLPSQQS